MTTTLTKLTTCPSWCSLKPGHGWDSVHDDGRMSRGHQGPGFGRFLFTGSLEMESGETAVDVEIHTDDGVELTASDLLDLAADAVAAALWLEAHR